MNTAADQVQKHRLTVAEYHRMGETGIIAEDARVELIEGEIFDMAPIGSSHAGTVNYLISLLAAAAADRAIVSVQNPMVLGDHSEPEPDLCLLRPRADFYRGSHPEAADVLLAIEVAESSLRHDRDVKRPLYAHYAIPEFWLIDLQGRQLMVFRDAHGDEYRNEVTLTSPGVLSPVALPQVSVDLSALF